MPKLFKIVHNLLCEKCRKSRYFCGRVLARILCSWKVYEVFHVCFGETIYFWAFGRDKNKVLSSKLPGPLYLYMTCYSTNIIVLIKRSSKFKVFPSKTLPTLNLFCLLDRVPIKNRYTQRFSSFHFSTNQPAMLHPSPMMDILDMLEQPWMEGPCFVVAMPLLLDPREPVLPWPQVAPQMEPLVPGYKFLKNWRNTGYTLKLWIWRKDFG